MAFIKNTCCWLNEHFAPSPNCYEKATGIEAICIACPDDITLAIELAADSLCTNGYVSGISIPNLNFGFTTYELAVEEGQDLLEQLNFVLETSALDTLEQLIFTLQVDNPNHLCQIRSMVGKELVVIIKLKNKTGDFQFMIVNGGGGMKVTEINGGVKKQHYEVTLSGDPNIPSLFIDAGSLALTEDLIDDIKVPDCWSNTCQPAFWRGSNDDLYLTESIPTNTTNDPLQLPNIQTFTATELSVDYKVYFPCNSTGISLTISVTTTFGGTLSSESITIPLVEEVLPAGSIVDGCTLTEDVCVYIVENSTIDITLWGLDPATTDYNVGITAFTSCGKTGAVIFWR